MSVRRLLLDRDHVRLVAFVGMLYILLDVLQSVVVSVVSLPILAVFDVTAALPVPLVLTLGPTALWGIPLGYLGADIATNAIRPGTLVGAGAHLYLGYAARKLAKRFEIELTITDADVMQKPSVSQLLLITGIAAGGATAITGWGSEVVRETPFYIAAPLAFGEYFILTLAAMILLIGLLPTLITTNAPRLSHYFPESEDLELDAGFNLRRVVLITFVWILFGTLGSLGYRIFERIPHYLFSERNLEFILVLNRPILFGIGAGRVQVVSGAVLVSILVLTFINPEYSGGDTRR